MAVDERWRFETQEPVDAAPELYRFDRPLLFLVVIALFWRQTLPIECTAKFAIAVDNPAHQSHGDNRPNSSE
ncbi:TPA: hypothetical protein I8393_003170 [Serratia marcescens]|uniref:hypothetical protein n=1 Tax=Serratia TaxID=613 RepID=UPI001A2BDA4B|nr:hypothetical protein [Serratia marcescens]MDP8620028.1 hypothetical protein [Serratia marcescens]HAT2907683.1 hypothetical protein [Serratia marcescens]